MKCVRMHTHVFSVRACRFMHPCSYMQSQRRTLGICHPSPHFLETGVTDPGGNLTFLSEATARKFQKPSCLCPHSTRVTAHVATADFTWALEIHTQVLMVTQHEL